uniref:NADH dehydrogenase subunit 6 n=1 Tax=Gruberia lanceolata TaxID=1978530 RepID=A0A6C0UAC7_9CILI|nr:NADH dehydrogenase subunit 6 [Gruberia lanceolata]
MNLIFDLIFHVKGVNFLEFILQIILLYNLIQILRQDNFYYMLGYFLNFILFLGINFVMYDLDIVAIILWIVYGGVIIIFFIYSMMWIDYTKFYSISSKLTLLQYFIICFFIIFIIFFFSIEFTNESENLVIYQIFWNNYYEILQLDLNEELDILGWGVLYYSTFYFLIISYFLFLACCCVVFIIISTRKIKYKNAYTNYNYIFKNQYLYNFTIYRYQYFYLQDYENTYKLNSVNKNFKISNKFYKVKTFKRWV